MSEVMLYVILPRHELQTLIVSDSRYAQYMSRLDKIYTMCFDTYMSIGYSSPLHLSRH
jgi:hypothetical protein